MEDVSPNSKTEQFVKLFLANHRRINGFLISLVPQQADVDDLLQETAAALWQKFDEFEPGTDFAAWALRFAHFIVLKYHERRRTQGRVAFDESLIRSIGEEFAVVAPQVDPRQEALRRCLGRLSPKARSLVELRYASGGSVKRAALHLNQSVESAYKALRRIRQSLLECIERSMAREGLV